MRQQTVLCVARVVFGSTRKPSRIVSVTGGEESFVWRLEAIWDTPACTTDVLAHVVSRAVACSRHGDPLGTPPTMAHIMSLPCTPLWLIYN